jgi:uncharacterized YigZ family protein
MPEFSFNTLQGECSGVYKEKGSKFLAFAFPVRTKSQAKEIFEGVKRRYFDARHHCFAWMLGPGQNEYRASDDGEPNHSAGDPILGQIRSKGLTNVIIVVVRYFGGVKLGVGGLINAYRSAAEAALNNGSIIEEEVYKQVTVEYTYPFTAEVMRLVTEFELNIEKQEFTDACRMEVSLALRHESKFLEKVERMKQIGISITVH